MTASNLTPSSNEASNHPNFHVGQRVARLLYHGGVERIETITEIKNGRAKTDNYRTFSLEDGYLRKGSDIRYMPATAEQLEADEAEKLRHRLKRKIAFDGGLDGVGLDGLRQIAGLLGLTDTDAAA